MVIWAHLLGFICMHCYWTSLVNGRSMWSDARSHLYWFQKFDHCSLRPDLFWCLEVLEMLRNLGEKQSPGKGGYVDRGRLVAVAAITHYPGKPSKNRYHLRLKWWTHERPFWVDMNDTSGNPDSLWDWGNSDKERKKERKKKKALTENIVKISKRLFS